MSVDLARWQGGLAYQGLLLGVVALVTSSVLSGGNRLTRDAIAERHREDLLATLEQVLPAGPWDNDPLADTVHIPRDGGTQVVYRTRREGEVTGAAFRVRGEGYGGPIRLLLGVARDGRVSGVRVLSHTETPGLGDKIERAKSDWITSFRGRSLDNTPEEAWTVKKDGGVFDQFTGATITPRAVVTAVHCGLERFRRHRARILNIDRKAADSAPHQPEDRP